MSPFVQIQGLYKSFPPSKEMALSDINASISAGKMMGIVGPDGAGKTTLIRLIAALLKPSQGSIQILEKDTISDSEEIHALTGYMPQRFGLYDELTVLQNLKLYFELQGIEKEKEEKLFSQLLEFTRLFPFKNRLAKDLSGGMRQKLGLACALLKTPKLLLLDEPSVGVDPLSRRELWKMVHELIKEGISVIWSTVYLDEAEKCDEIFLMNQGKVLFLGDPKEMLNKMEGRVFLSRGIETPQAILKDLKTEKDVVDAILQADQLRVVLSSNVDPKLWLDQRKQYLLYPTSPRLEDAFIEMLGGGPKVDSKLAHLRSDNCENHEDETYIEIEDLTKRFNGFVAVDSISFKVKKGEVFGLLGPNGAGKSTTFKMLCGLLTPSSGKAQVLGIDLKKSPAKIRKRIGYMAQRFSLYGNISVLQNLEFFAGVYGLEGDEKKKAIEQMADLFALKPYFSTTADLLPLGYKQRLSLACATMHQPDLLFLDEPTSGVDPLMRREFWNHIRALVEHGVTVMITTHFMDEAEYCDRIALIYRGKMIHVDTPHNLKKQAHAESLDEAFIHLIEEYDRT